MARTAQYGVGVGCNSVASSRKDCHAYVESETLVTLNAEGSRLN